MHPNDLLRSQLKGMGYSDTVIDAMIAAPSVKPAVVPIPYAADQPFPDPNAPHMPSDESLGEVMAAIATLGPLEGLAKAVGLTAQPHAQDLAPNPKAAVPDPKHPNQKDSKHMNAQERHALSVEGMTPTPTVDPMITSTTPEWEFQFVAAPVIVKVRAATESAARERAGSLFDPLVATWELVIP